MLFRALKPTYINDRIIEAGQEVDVDIELLAKNPDGTVNMAKHTSLEPLEPLPEPTVKVAPVPLTPVNTGQTSKPTGEAFEKALIGALQGLEHDRDDHWTESGKPGLKALEQTLGFKVTRDEVDKLAPNFVREKPAA